MGNVSSGPVTSKECGDGWADELGLMWSYSGMQGWRDSMEDAHLTISSLGQSSNSQASDPGWDDVALFGVLDGHGGEHVARFCQHYLPVEITRSSSQNVENALVDAFHRMDELLYDPDGVETLQLFGNRASMNVGHLPADPRSMGCTAVLCCVREDSIIVANAGDSRAVLCRNGKAIDLSEDHKPNMPSERARITRAGGAVQEQRSGPNVCYRVNGGLNLSRAIGDLGYKQNMRLPPQEQMVCCMPDVKTFRRQPGDEFLVIACDGVWDVLSSQDVVDHIRMQLGTPGQLYDMLTNHVVRLSAILEDLLDRCISPNLKMTFGIGGDNMTIVLVVFLRRPNGREAAWQAWACPYC